MRIEKVTKIPKVDTTSNRVSEYSRMTTKLDRIMAADMKFGKLIFNKSEYANTRSAYIAVNKGVERHNYPLKLLMRNHELYFIRTDMK